MRSFLAVAAILFLASPAAAQSKPGSEAVQEVVVPPLPPGATVSPVSLTRMKTDLRDDQTVGTAWVGVLCVEPHAVTWKDAAPEFVGLGDLFGQELKQAGFRPDKDPGDLFADAETTSADLQVGFVLKDMHASYCVDLVHISGKITLDVDWQVYSTVRRQVVARIETNATAQRARGLLAKVGARSLVQAAFAANVRTLLANEQFRAAVLAPAARAPTAAEATAGQPPILLANSTAAAMEVAEATKSVVSVFAGPAFGSAVLISDDGYLLTNAHVVAASTSVRVRWWDGSESIGQVIRSDKGRDVALIKTSVVGRRPLRIQRVAPPVGTSVFAIGTPLDPKLQNTVTRGVISGTRVINGFSFLQSDTPVTHGNSGGPLIDESGAVVALTDLGLPPEEGSSINFFIPITDALDFVAGRAADPPKASGQIRKTPTGHKKS